MTRQQYELNCEILQSLDNIDNCVMESEIQVLTSLIDQYYNALVIMEGCSDTATLTSFGIIQESSDVIKADVVSDSNKRGVVKTLIEGIKKLLYKLVEIMKSVGDKVTNLVKKAIMGVGKQVIIYMSYDMFDVIRSKFNKPIEDSYVSDILEHPEYITHIKQCANDVNGTINNSLLTLSFTPQSSRGSISMKLGTFDNIWGDVIVHSKYGIFAESQRLKDISDKLSPDTFDTSVLDEYRLASSSMIQVMLFLNHIATELRKTIRV